MMLVHTKLFALKNCLVEQEQCICDQMIIAVKTFSDPIQRRNFSFVEGMAVVFLESFLWSFYSRVTTNTT